MPQKSPFCQFFQINFANCFYIRQISITFAPQNLKTRFLYTFSHNIMAKKKNQPTRTKLEEINDSLSGIEQKFEQHKNLIYIIVAAILVVAFGIWAYYNFGYKKDEANAQKEMTKADQMHMTGQDSLALTTYESVAKKYGNNLIFKSGVGNLANLYTAQIYYDKGKYAEAQKYLEDYSPKGKVLGALSQNLLGDTYVNQNQYDKALKAYDNAIGMSKESFWDRLGWLDIVLFVLALAALIAFLYFARTKDEPKLRRLVMITSAIIFLASAGLLAYLFMNKNGDENREVIAYSMLKKATVLDAQKKYDEEVKIYEEIEAKYYGPGSMSMQIERAKAKSGK